jgi:membrane protease YdiL (CAAX protease family)
MVVAVISTLIFEQERGNMFERKDFLPAFTWLRFAVVIVLAVFASLGAWFYFTSIAPLPGWSVRYGIPEWLMRNWVLGIGPVIIAVTVFVIHFGLTKMPTPEQPPIQYPLRPEMKNDEFWGWVDSKKAQEAERGRFTGQFDKR